MMELWKQSQRASGKYRTFVRVMTKSAFMALAEDERGRLLDDFIIVKDTDVLPHFLPRSVDIFSMRGLKA